MADTGRADSATTTRQPGWLLGVAGDAVRRMALFHLLEREGLRATVADDTHAALTMLRTEPFALVLLDSSSPLFDSGAILTEIRADPPCAAFPSSSLPNPPTIASLPEYSPS